MRRYTFTITGNKYSVDIKSIEENTAEIEVNGTSYQVELGKEMKAPATPKLIRPMPTTPPKAPAPLNTAGVSLVKAPLPGTILKVMVAPGATIKREQPLLVLEAMKMENNILAEKDGTVKAIKVNEGDTVLQGDTLLEID
ncbi:MAG: biotin/lipoyl-containing protein [Candidatus Chlorobium antarcticum]|jgi:biotin carboxyl carrier protein|nr:biotin/lipoyl-containing protein [Candidatus Chlorobium antarcticum]